MGSNATCQYHSGNCVGVVTAKSGCSKDVGVYCRYSRMAAGVDNGGY